ncbi:MAG TPA: hypothetical protein VMT30_08390 [Candidatus Saccharimonadia bacterium]|nr:hypothetical protein [Candidatus Saccharimonadia bacterium]
MTRTARRGVIARIGGPVVTVSILAIGAIVIANSTGTKTCKSAPGPATPATTKPASASSDCSTPPGSQTTALRHVHTYYGTSTKTGYAMGAQYQVGPISGNILPFSRGKREASWTGLLTAFEGDPLTIDITGVGDANPTAKVACAFYRITDPANLRANAVPANLVGVPQSGTGPKGHAHCEIISGE